MKYVKKRKKEKKHVKIQFIINEVAAVMFVLWIFVEFRKYRLL